MVWDLRSWRKRRRDIKVGDQSFGFTVPSGGGYWEGFARNVSPFSSPVFFPTSSTWSLILSTTRNSKREENILEDEMWWLLEVDGYC